MKIRPLIIGPEDEQRIRRAIELARQRIVPPDVVTALAMKDKFHVSLSDRPEGAARTIVSELVVLPIGYHVAVSFEQQPAGLCKHLSVSVDEVGKLPNIHSVQMIAWAYGMKFTPETTKMWTEEFSPGHDAINIVELESTT